MKYSTPSIEVVTFNASDAPRVGMQWWVDVGNGQWSPLGMNWTAPSGNPLRLRYAHGIEPAFGCDDVTIYGCDNENIPGGYVYVGDQNVIMVADDHKSC